MKNVVVALSGGVDSAVTAILLKRKGFKITAAYLKCWDHLDETNTCHSNNDMRDAESIARKLKIEFTLLIWPNLNYRPFLNAYKNGKTPNPDVLCNRHIKFDIFQTYATKKLNANAIATGHYANLLFHYDLRFTKTKPLDYKKDQTYFLSMIKSENIQNCIFPLGNLMKLNVRQIAKESGLNYIANKKDSMGLCFIGNRDFKQFLNEVSKQDHSALFTNVIETDTPSWLSGIPRLLCNKSLKCYISINRIQNPQTGYVKLKKDGGLFITMNKLQRAVTPGQTVVLYLGNVCIGGASIIKSQN